MRFDQGPARPAIGTIPFLDHRTMEQVTRDEVQAGKMRALREARRAEAQSIRRARKFDRDSFA